MPGGYKPSVKKDRSDGPDDWAGRGRDEREDRPSECSIYPTEFDPFDITLPEDRPWFAVDSRGGLEAGNRSNSGTGGLDE